MKSEHSLWENVRKHKKKHLGRLDGMHFSGQFLSVKKYAGCGLCGIMQSKNFTFAECSIIIDTKKYAKNVIQK